MRSLLTAALTVCLTLPLASPALAQTRRDTLQIDALDGSGKVTLRVARDAAVVVRLTNVNPFLRQYRIAGTQTVYSESAVIADFAKLALGFTLSVPASTAPTSLQPAFGDKSAMTMFMAPISKDPGAYCATANANNAAVGLEQQTTRLASLRTELVAAIDTARKTTGRLGDAAGSHRSVLRNETTTTGQLQTAGALLLPIVSAYADTVALRSASLVDLVTAFNASVTSYAAVAVKESETFPECAYFARRRADAASWGVDTTVFRGISTRLGSLATALNTERDGLARVKANAALLRIERQLGGYDAPTLIQLVIQSSPIGTDTVWRTIASPQIDFGSARRFGVVVGVLGSDHRIQDFAVTKEYKSPPTGAEPDSIVSRITMSRDSRLTLPMVGLSVRVTPVHRLGVDAAHLVMGAVPRGEASATTFDFLTGLGVSAFDERVMITAGMLATQQKSLAPGYAVGQRVPTELTVAPMVSQRVQRLAIGVLVRAY